MKHDHTWWTHLTGKTLQRNRRHLQRVESPVNETLNEQNTNENSDKVAEKSAEQTQVADETGTVTRSGRIVRKPLPYGEFVLKLEYEIRSL